jgi:hypothetical protein
LEEEDDTASYEQLQQDLIQEFYHPRPLLGTPPPNMKNRNMHKTGNTSTSQKHNNHNNHNNHRLNKPSMPMEKRKVLMSKWSSLAGNQKPVPAASHTENTISKSSVRWSPDLPLDNYHQHQRPHMHFDDIDAGVGGGGEEEVSNLYSHDLQQYHHFPKQPHPHPPTNPKPSSNHSIHHHNHHHHHQFSTQQDSKPSSSDYNHNNNNNNNNNLPASAAISTPSSMVYDGQSYHPNKNHHQQSTADQTITMDEDLQSIRDMQRLFDTALSLSVEELSVFETTQNGVLERMVFHLHRRLFKVLIMMRKMNMTNWMQLRDSTITKSYPMIERLLSKKIQKLLILMRI